MSEAPSQAWPVNENVSFVNREEIFKYLNVLFYGIEWNERRWIGLRGIGEKGTKQEGDFREDRFISPLESGCSERIYETAIRYAKHHVAFFCVPCVLREQRGTAANVELFTCLVADLDSGNTTDKLNHMADHVGPPTMVVSSGGVTPEGTDKFHVYYRLDIPTDDIQRVVMLRDEIAKKCGGDPMFGLGVKSNPFGRAHQPIRVAGSCHAKNGVARAVRIIHLNENQVYTLDGIEQAIHAMQYGPWFTPEEVENATVERQESLPFSASAEQGKGPAINETLTKPVYEGGTDTTRWGEFSKVAGHYVRMVRDSHMTTDEALEKTQGWVLANMMPPWPPARVDKEFWAIHSRDVQTNGSMPKPSQAPATIPTPQNIVPYSQAPLIAPQNFGDDLRAWAAWRWVSGDKPHHEFLVDRFIVRGEAHLYVSEGGAGKTYQLLDLGMKVAAYEPAKALGIDLYWNGFKITGGGPVVAIFNEDSRKEIHIRLVEIDQQGLIQMAGDNFFPLPMGDLIGSFPLAVHDSRSGTSASHPAWDDLLKKIKAVCPNPAMVIIDTLNSVSHADENSAIGTNEMMREGKRVCSELRCSLVMTHHLRKPGNEPIRSLEELKEAIRGSSALVNAFRVCFGMFKAIDYDRRMKAMGLKAVKNALWRFGIVKANINGLFIGEKTLLRAANGMLEDCTDMDKYNSVNGAERMAWLVLAIKLAARAGHPYVSGGKNAKNGLYARRSELPVILRKVGDSEFRVLLENALQEGLLVLTAKGGKEKKWIDGPDGLLSIDSPDGEIKEGSYNPPDFSQYIYRPGDHVVLHKDEQPLPFQNGVSPIMDAEKPTENLGLWAVHMTAAANDTSRASTPAPLMHAKGAPIDD